MSKNQSFNQMIENKTSIDHTEIPAKSRNIEAIHHAIGHTFDKFVTVLSIVFDALPNGVHVMKISGDSSTAVHRSIISNKFGGCTMHANMILKSTKKTFSRSILCLENIINTRDKANKDVG